MAPGDLSLADVGRPSEHRLHLVAALLASGETIDAVAAASRIDPWFVDQIAQVVEGARELIGRPLEEILTDELRHAKRLGLSDERIGELTDRSAGAVRARRDALGVTPVFKTVDTCAGEFAARTPYHYSTYQEETETVEADRPRVVILGAGPNRIGQGIEFDYACVHAAFALEEAGFVSVMINSNPVTVSTDYDTASRR